MRLSFCMFTVAIMVAGPSSGWAQDENQPDAQLFRDHVEPILRRSCFSCHGSEKQEGGLRLDDRERALAGGDSGPLMVAGNSGASRLVRLVRGTDEDLGRMPPDGEGTPLSADEIAWITRWIDEGAHWPAGIAAKRSEHWSLQSVTRPAVSKTQNRTWAQNPIDQFVLRRLESLGVAPSPPADRPTLIRRVFLDLLGIPPAPDEVLEFVKDARPDAYERMVDRVLSSPHYGERWARHWLDLARYADSDGYEKDRPRPFAWRYRDWVIDALNRDRGFDRFSIEQIAGDLLPDATVDQRIATGFHRNTLHNTEGGTDQEEDRFKKTVDRTNTFGAIWLGMTVGCAQCHSHKYDPLSQREYYSLFAYFNSLREVDLPVALPGERDAFDQQLRAYHRRLAELEKDVREFEAAESTRLVAMESALADAQFEWLPLTSTGASSSAGATLQSLDDASLLVSGTNVVSDVYTIEVTAPIRRATALRLEVLPDDSQPKKGPGRAANGNFVLSRIGVTAPGMPPREIAWSGARADFSQKGWDVNLAINDTPADGWAVGPQVGKRHVAVFQFAEPLVADEALRLTIRLDQTYKGDTHNLGRFRLSVIDLPGLAPLDDLSPELRRAIAAGKSERTPEQQKLVTRFVRTLDPDAARVQKALDKHRQSKPKLQATATQVIAQTDSPNETHLHERGEFLQVGELVEVGTPSVCSPSTDSAGPPTTRLDLARWLFEETHPLTSRVAVNRVWSRIFGRGLVATVDDFGTQGAPPTHPELLDWLAAEMRDSDWSMKRLQRLIVTSSVYRQTSTHRPEFHDRDPDNEWLARQNRFRVEAEIVRDLAIVAGGQWDARIGGPSVRPPQPAEYSALTYANSAKWAASKGGDQFRRGMYTFFQRTSPYPMLMTFDSPDSNECTATRATSNTPLQALTLWNDPVFFAAAQALGRRLLREVPGDDPGQIEQRIDRAFMICFGRRATADEQSTIAAVVREVAAAEDESYKLLIGTEPLGPEVSVADVAAWVMVARILMNLDEFVTKE